MVTFTSPNWWTMLVVMIVWPEKELCIVRLRNEVIQTRKKKKTNKKNPVSLCMYFVFYHSIKHSMTDLNSTSWCTWLVFGPWDSGGWEGIWMSDSHTSFRNVCSLCPSLLLPASKHQSPTHPPLTHIHTASRSGAVLPRVTWVANRPLELPTPPSPDICLLCRCWPPRGHRSAEGLEGGRW